MLKKIFHWQYSGVAIPFFYAAGLAFWGLAVSTDPYVPLFITAASFMLVGFIWSLGWLWTREMFSRHKVSVRGRRKAEFIKIEDSQKLKSLWIATFMLTFPLLAAETLLHTSYVSHRADKAMGKVSVLFGDNKKMRGIEVPFGNKNFSDALKKSVDGIATVTYAASTDPTQHLVSVIIRNDSDITIKNANIAILCVCKIKGITNGARPFSDTEVSYEVREIRPYSHLSEEHHFSIQIPNEGAAYLTVTIEADNLISYAAVGKVLTLKRQ